MKTLIENISSDSENIDFDIIEGEKRFHIKAETDLIILEREIEELLSGCIEEIHMVYGFLIDIFIRKEKNEYNITFNDDNGDNKSVIVDKKEIEKILNFINKTV